MTPEERNLSRRMRDELEIQAMLSLSLSTHFPPPDPVIGETGTLYQSILAVRKRITDLVEEYDRTHEVRSYPTVQPVSIPVGQDTLREIGADRGDHIRLDYGGSDVPMSQNDTVPGGRSARADKPNTAMRRCNYFSCPHTPTCLESAVPFGDGSRSARHQHAQDAEPGVQNETSDAYSLQEGTD